MAGARDRVLIEIVTAANMAGIKQAQAGMLGLNVATVALAVTLGTVIILGKAAIENSRAQADALGFLDQAYKTSGDNLERHRKEIEAWLETNRRFISNQYEAETAMATVIRAGLTQAETFRLMDDALDLAALKHMTLAEATAFLLGVQFRYNKGLTQLGITLADYNRIMKDDTLTAEQKHAALLDLIEAKTRRGKNTTDEVIQSQNNLTKSWQDFTSRMGPKVVEQWAAITDAIASGVQILDLYYQLTVKIHDLAAAGLAGLGKGGVTGPIAGPNGISPRGTGSGAHPQVVVNVQKLSGKISDDDAKMILEAVRRANRALE